MPTVLHLYHNAHFDLVDQEELGDAESLGTYEVQNAKTGEAEERFKVLIEQPDNFTEVLIPDGYDASPVALSQLVGTLADRHAAAEHITGVWCEDARLGARVAALLGVDTVEEQA